MLGEGFAILAEDADAAEIERALLPMGYPLKRVSPDELIESVGRGTVTAALITDSRFPEVELGALREAIATQPHWTDLPILFVCTRREVLHWQAQLDALHQVRIVERPIDRTLVQRAAASAARSRSCQAAVQSLLGEQKAGEAAHRALTASLESRIARVTAGLEGLRSRLGAEIEERRLAEARLRESEERYRLAARATNDAIWDLDLTTDMIRWSDAASSFFGYDNGDAPTPSDWWRSRIHPDDRERIVTGFYGAIESGAEIWSDHYRFRAADGTYLDIFDRGSIIRDDHGRLIRAVGAMSDITERRRTEAEMRQMQSDLIHVSRLNAMGAMASTLAHELNQPLTAVANYLKGSRRLLETRGETAIPDVLDALANAERGAIRAGEILRRLRGHVSRGPAATQTEDLVRLVQQAQTLALVDAPSLGIKHRTRIEIDDPMVDVDPVQIEQVLINLLRNAVEAIDGRPTREIETTLSPAHGNMVQVSVSDTGIGFPGGVPDDLFTPFHSGKPGGLGIGLSISRTIIDAHGGKIWAQPRPGGGATFCFTVPAARR